MRDLWLTFVSGKARRTKPVIKKQNSEKKRKVPQRFKFCGRINSGTVFAMMKFVIQLAKVLSVMPLPLSRC